MLAHLAESHGRARRREREIAPYLFTGVQLLHRRLFEGIEEPRFSLNRIYDRAEAAGRLHGIVHDGEWYHIGTLEGLAATRERLSFHRTFSPRPFISMSPVTSTGTWSAATS